MIQKLSTTTPSNIEVESYLNAFEQKIIGNATLNGSQDGQRQTELSETEFKIKMLEPVQNQVQHAINHVRGLLQPSAKVLDVTEIRRNAEAAVGKLQRESDFSQRKVLELEHELKALNSDPLRRKHAKWLLRLSVICASADAILAYSSFRSSSPFLLSVISAFTVGLAVFASHFCAEWFIYSKTRLQVIIKSIIVLGSAFILFSYIGNLRALSLNSVPDISIPNTEVILRHSSQVSGWMIAAISEILFATILYFSILFWRSKEEKRQDNEYVIKKGEIDRVKDEGQHIRKEMASIEADALSQSRDARERVAASIDAIKKCKTIGISAIHAYKIAYLNFHMGVVPSFFAGITPPLYDDALHFFSSEKQTA